MAIWGKRPKDGGTIAYFDVWLVARFRKLEFLGSLVTP
jgi:hypothetical protein